MFRFETRWLLRIFDAIFPPAVPGGPTLGAADVPLDGLLVDIRASAPADFTLGVRAAAWVVTLFGPLLVGKLTRFSKLEREERAQVLEGLAGSRWYLLREIPMLLKMVASLGYAGAPDVQRQLGLPEVDAEAPAWWFRAAKSGDSATPSANSKGAS